MKMPQIGVKPFRPPEYTGKSDPFLSKIHRELLALLKKLKKSQPDGSLLDLPPGALDQLTGVFVEFAEDLHNDIGIWRSYEHYNREFFGTPLPLLLKPGEDVAPQELQRCRLHHLLWNLYPEFDPDIILAPTHDELYSISEVISDFLAEEFADVPQDSGVKKFLSEPVQFGWDVKRKLVWLGTRSYLFRYLFGNYVEEHGGSADISTTDDFICQADTTWSGLGVIDILAAILDITEDQRRDLRNWYERHVAVFKVLSINPQTGIMQLTNLINDKPYTVRAGDQTAPFKANMFVQGSLVPWNGEWYWSGEQSVYQSLSQQNIQDLKQHFTIRASNIAYRYCDDLAQKARETIKIHYDEFIKFHGSDFIFYPDGLALAEDTEKQLQAFNKSREQELPGQHDKKQPSANINISDFLDQYLEMENGVALYFNPNEGQEMMEEFNDVLGGLKKKGVGLTQDEADGLRGLIFSDVLSPGFVRRVVQEYGHEAIAPAFLIKDVEDDLYLEYLLRRHKGHFYKKRYPSLSFV
jgi:hypothetical protein